VSPTRFVIAAFPRTGSNWLCGVLNSHPQVICHYEVFHPKAVYYAHSFPEWRPQLRWTLERRDADPRGFADWLYASHYGHAAVGLKLMHGHAPEVAAELLRDPSVRTIVLRRRNRVRVFLSAKRATAAGKFTQVSYDGMRIALDAGELQEFCAEYDAYFDGVGRLVAGKDVLRLSYEELFDDGRVGEVLSFLGLDPDHGPLAAKHVRQSSDSLRSAIANFDELAERLAGTPLLDDLLAESAVAAR
jgi:LPS sulfotransferase NodH